MRKRLPANRPRIRRNRCVIYRLHDAVKGVGRVAGWVFGAATTMLSGLAGGRYGKVSGLIECV